MKRLISGIGRAFLTVLVILLLGFGWALFETKIMLKPYPELFGYIFYQETSDDMLPEFSKTDIVIVAKDAKYSKGDKVLFLDKNSEYKVRTVASSNADSLIVKCDSCEKDSESTTSASVMGKAIGKVSQFGSVITFFKQKWFLIAIGIVGIICISISQYMKTKPQKTE